MILVMMIVVMLIVVMIVVVMMIVVIIVVMIVVHSNDDSYDNGLVMMVMNATLFYLREGGLHCCTLNSLTIA